MSDFLDQMADACVKELVALGKKNITNADKYGGVMKPYLEKIYAEYVKIPGTSVEARNIKQPIPEAGGKTANEIYNRYPFMNEEKLEGQYLADYIKYPFVGDASFLTNYQKLLKGYSDITAFNLDEYKKYENIKKPEEVGIFQPKTQIPLPGQNFIDTYANSKYYYPEDRDQYIYQTIYPNKPINDVANSTNMTVLDQQAQSMQSPWHTLRSALGTPSTTTEKKKENKDAREAMNRSFKDDDARIRKNIELLGGIEQTIPNMEKSFQDNEMKHVDPMTIEAYLDHTSNARFNHLIHNSGEKIKTATIESKVRANSPMERIHPNLNKPPISVQTDPKENFWKNFIQIAKDTSAKSPGSAKENSIFNSTLPESAKVTLSTSKNSRLERTELLSKYGLH